MAWLVGPETNAAPSLVPSKSLFDGSRADLSVLPVSVQSVERFSFESAARVVAVDQFGIADRRILFVIPRLPYPEVAQHVLGYVRFQRNPDERIEDFRGLCKGNSAARPIQHSELGELTKQGQIGLQVLNEIRKPIGGLSQVGECHHTRGRGKEHWKLVDEVPNARSWSVPDPRPIREYEPEPQNSPNLTSHLTSHII